MTEKPINQGLCLADLDTYEWPVDVKVPSNGDYETYRFTGRFRYMDKDEVKKIMADIKPPKINKKDPFSAYKIANYAADQQVKIYMQIWRGWGDELKGHDGKPLPYSEEAKRKLLAQKIFREAVVRAYEESQAGEVARLGNLETLPDSGQPEEKATDTATPSD